MGPCALRKGLYLGGGERAKKHLCVVDGSRIPEKPRIMFWNRLVEKRNDHFVWGRLGWEECHAKD